LQQLKLLAATGVALAISFSSPLLASGKTGAEIELGISRENLDSGYSDWRGLYLEGKKDLAARQTIYARLDKTERFDQRDTQLLAGYYHPLGERTTGVVEASISGTHRILPEWSTLVQLEQQLGQGFGLQGGYRHTEYRTDTVDQGILGVERYWGDYRAAYTLYLSHLSGSSTVGSHLLRLDYYYAERSSVGLLLARGKEAENLGSGSVVIDNTHAAGIIGRHALTRRWALSYELQSHDQDDRYRRNLLRVGIRCQL
jgi:YaiO family outer membrane protein